MAKKKIAKLTDKQYAEYIMTLKNDKALYSTDGEMFVPDEINVEKGHELDCNNKKP